MRRRAAAGVLLGVLTLAAAPAPVGGQVSPPAGPEGREGGLEARLEARVEEARARWRVPGVGLAVVAGDSVGLARGFGTRHDGRRDPVGPGTVFALGSVTKGITGLLAGLLVQEGLLGWRDPVTTHVSGVVVGDRERTRRLTVDDIVTHRSGLPRTLLLFYGRSLSHRQMVERLRYVDPVLPLRDAFGYQNVVYSLVADVVAAAADLPFESVLRQRILAPLGMSDAGIGDPASRGLDDVAVPHVGDAFGPPRPVAWYSPAGVPAAGGLHASARDLRSLLRYLLGADDPGRPRLPRTVREEVMTPRTLVPVGDPVNTLLSPVGDVVGLVGYGRGWFVNQYRGERMVWVAGDIDGMSAIVALLPARRAGIAVLTNRQLPQLLGLAVVTGFLDDILGVPSPADRRAEAYGTVTAAMAAARERSRVAPLDGWEAWTGPPPTTLEGRYRHPAYGELVVESRGEEVHFRLDRRLTGQLLPASGGRLVVEWDDPVLAWGIPLTLRVEEGDAGSPVLVVPTAGSFRAPSVGR